METTAPIKYVEYHASDLRFTGWEHECIIINRSLNHYMVPEHRFKELMSTQGASIPKPYNPNEGVSGSAGCCGTVGKSNSI